MKSFRIFLTIALLTFSVTASPYVVIAAVSQFMFVTSPQNIPLDTLSEIITVQSQDSSGVKENIANTMYVTVTSSSATGELFSNTTGGSLTSPVTMSKNSANKNFYYKDSAAGMHTIHVVVASEKGGATLFSADQNITVGSGGSGAETVHTTSSEIQTETTSGSGSSGSASAHSSPAPLSTEDEKIEFEISGGRDRLTTVGNTIEFQVVPTKIQNVSEGGITYTWSFGDGATGQGNAPHYTYRFPGDYAVVVNGAYSDKKAVSRLQVKVVSPAILLARVSGGLEITNKSGVEINLEGWSLSGSKKVFVFPTDTLIPNGKKVIFANEVTGMDSGNILLLNPMQREIARLDGEAAFVPEVTPATISATTTPVNLKDLQAKLDEAKIKLAQLTPPKPSPRVPLGETVRVTLAQSELKSGLHPATTTAQTAVIFEAPAQTGIVTNIISWPMRGFNFIKHLFVED